MTLPDCSGQFDLVVTPGTSLSQVFQFNEDVSAYTWTAEAYQYNDSPAPLAAFTVDQTQAATGLLVVSMSAGDTDTLFDRPKQYWWKLIATLGSDVLWPLQGPIFTDQLVQACDCNVILSDCEVEVTALGIGVPGPPGDQIPTFTAPGSLVVMTGLGRYYFLNGATIKRVLASVGQAPGGASIVVDVNLDGTTIFTTQANRPTIPVGQFVDLTSTPDVTAAPAGSYLTVDIDQIGSTTAGSDLVVQVEYA